MNMFRTVVAAIILTIYAAGAPLPAFAQPTFASAEVALEAATEILGDKTIATAEPEALWRIQEILKLIIEEFPASDLAVQILLQDKIGNLDIAAFNRRIVTLPIPTEATPPTAMTNVDPLEQAISGALEERRVNEALTATDSAIAATEALAAQAKEDALREAEAAAAAAAENARIAAIAARERAATEAAEQAQREQQAAEEARRTATNFNSTRFTFGLRPLAIKLNECYVNSRRGIYRAIDTVIFSIGDNNRVEGMPELQNAENANRSGRMLFVNIMAALTECGTFERRYANRRYEATFTGTELIRLVYKAVPEAPWTLSNEATHRELELGRKDIAELQARLTALEIDPNGVDGVFGRGTRSAISTWQERNRIPTSGYLDQRQWAELKEKSEMRFQAWLSADGNQAVLDRAGHPRASSASRNPRGWWRDSRGLYCRRAFLGATWCQANRPRR